MLLHVAGCGESQGPVAPASVPPPNEAHVEQRQGPAEVFVSVLAELKEKTEVPILLPGALPGETERLWAFVEAEETDYQILIHYENDDGTQLGSGATFYGMFVGAKGQLPAGLPNHQEVREVKLADGNVGFFRPISCGGSCAPANLWWMRDGVSYHIQLKLFSSLSEQDQESTITQVANSAILGGPRKEQKQVLRFAQDDREISWGDQPCAEVASSGTVADSACGRSGQLGESRAFLRAMMSAEYFDM